MATEYTCVCGRVCGNKGGLISHQRRCEAHQASLKELETSDAITEGMAPPAAGRETPPGEETIEVMAADAAAAERRERELVEKADAQKVVTRKAVEDTGYMGVEALSLALALFKQVNIVKNNHKVFGALPHYQQCTLLGTYSLCGQVLRKKDMGGPIRINRFVAFHAHPDIVDVSVFEHYPEIPEQIARSLKLEAIDLKELGQDVPTIERAQDLHLLALSQARVEDIIQRDTPDLETFLAAVWEELRRLRRLPHWQKYFYDFQRKVMQGVQITCGQLLGLKDRLGPVTIARYMVSGVTDPVVFNALGLYRHAAAQTVTVRRTTG